MIIQEGITNIYEKKRGAHGADGKTLLGEFQFLDSSIERSRNTFEIETRIGYCCRNRLSAEWSLTKVFLFGRPMRLIEDVSSGCGKIKNANVSVPSTLQHFSSFMNRVSVPDTRPFSKGKWPRRVKKRSKEF